MRIALIGYGKMGRMIEKVVTFRGHELVLIVDTHNIDDLNAANLSKADIAIEFTHPGAVLQNIQACFDADIPVVIGTTGWYKYLPEVKKNCLEKDAALIYGSNFSIGVNLFFLINKLAARVMNNFSAQYNVILEEIHHMHKLDAPSGTAITLAEDIIANFEAKKDWMNILNPSTAVTAEASEHLMIKSIREGEAPGTHSVLYQSAVDVIELRHTAFNREGFALGAVLAAEWILGKKGFFSVKDMFNFLI